MKQAKWSMLLLLLSAVLMLAGCAGGHPDHRRRVHGAHGPEYAGSGRAEGTAADAAGRASRLSAGERTILLPVDRPSQRPHALWPSAGHAA